MAAITTWRDTVATGSLRPGSAEPGADRRQADAPTLDPRWSVVLPRWLLVAAALYGIGWLLWQAREAMMPFLLGLLAAYLLTPLVNRLERFMRRPFAILVVYLAAVAVSALGVMYVVPPVIDQAQRIVENIPTVDEARAIGSRWQDRYEAALPDAIQQPIDDVLDSALEAAETNATSFVQRAVAFVGASLLRIVNTVTFLLGFLIIPIWLFYVINDQRQGRAFLDRILHPRLRPDFWNVWRMVNKVFSDYIRGQLVLGVAIGVMAGLGLLLLRLLGFETKYILLLAIIAGITELIPILGPILGAIPAVLIALLGTEDPLRNTLAVVALYVVIQQLENNFLVPRIVGESVGVHPAILTVVLIAMGQVFGLLGVILSAPLAAVARDLFVYVYKRIGHEPPHTALREVFAEKSDVDMNAVDQPETTDATVPTQSEVDVVAKQEQRAAEHAPHQR
jgi:predicted PurR-regulated permease PerM